MGNNASDKAMGNIAAGLFAFIIHLYGNFLCMAPATVIFIIHQYGRHGHTS